MVNCTEVTRNKRKKTLEVMMTCLGPYGGILLFMRLGLFDYMGHSVIEPIDSCSCVQLNIRTRAKRESCNDKINTVTRQRLVPEIKFFAFSRQAPSYPPFLTPYSSLPRVPLTPISGYRRWRPDLSPFIRG